MRLFAHPPENLPILPPHGGKAFSPLGGVTRVTLCDPKVPIRGQGDA